MPVQIFLKMPTGNTVTLDVELTDTIPQFKEKIKAKHGMPEKVIDYRLFYGGKLLEGETSTLAKYGIDKEATVQVGYVSPPPDYAAEVRPILEADLKALGNVDKVLIFVGLGCYDHEHGEASIKRQQCPDALLKVCGEKKWNLRVLLIDPGFSISEGPDQIYDVDTEWKLVPSSGEKTTLVKRFKRGSDDFLLATYATKVPVNVYGGTEKTLAGVDMTSLALKESCLIMGNFYDQDNKPSVCRGNATVLKDLGYK